MLGEISPARIFARPTADELWLGPMQESALSHLTRTVPTRALLGPASSGRSTLLRHLAHSLAETAVTLAVAGAQRMSAAVLRSLLASAGLVSEGLSKGEMRRLLDVFIARQRETGRRVVLLIDDADLFGQAAWREIERLQKAAPPRGGAELLLSLVHIDAGGSPAADFIREQPAPLLAVLSWLGPRDVGWYLHWRLARFDLAELITPSAARLIARCTQGCFASIDHLCQMALLLLRKQGGCHVDVTLVREAMRILSRQYRLSPIRPQAETSAAELIVTQHGRLLRQIGIGERLLIGRSPVNDLCLDSPYISRHHAAIVRTDAGYFLSDLNSANGVSLNGQKVQSAPMIDGDVACLGPFRLKLRVSGSLPVRPAAHTDSVQLADTAVMPAPIHPEPAHLKVIK